MQIPVKQNKTKHKMYTCCTSAEHQCLFEQLVSYQVWVRQGVNGDKLFWDAKAATGSAWVLMVGEMSHIAVSANDQVSSQSFSFCFFLFIFKFFIQVLGSHDHNTMRLCVVIRGCASGGVYVPYIYMHAR